MYWDYAGGPATDLLVHTFTPIFCVLELDYPERVFGGGGTFEYNREVPDQCNIIADYAGGPSVVMTNSLSNHVPSDTIIRGTDGIITWAMLQGGKEYGVRIVPFGQGKKEILLPWKGQGDTSKLWLDLLDCVRDPRSSPSATSPWPSACRRRCRWASSRTARTRSSGSTRRSSRS